MRGLPPTIAILLATGALFGCATQDGEKQTTSDTSVDLTACERALQTTFDNGTADMEGGEQPPECDGATDQQIEELFNRMVEEEFATPPAVPEPEETEAPVAEIAKVGADEWFAYEDGIEVQVTKVEPYTLGEHAMEGNPGDPGVIVTVTIKNDTAAVFDASMAEVLVTYGPNGNATEREYDEAGFEGSIPPGKSATAKYDFSVVPQKDQDELLIQVSPDWDHVPTFFEGAAK
jgi:hypothetical protein